MATVTTTPIMTAVSTPPEPGEGEDGGVGEIDNRIIGGGGEGPWMG